MTRQVQLRCILTVDDGVKIEDLQREIKRRLREMPAEPLPGQVPAGDALPLEPGSDRTVFWPATDVRRGAETRAAPRRPEPVARPRGDANG